ncbi:MAG: DegT/DnrJ/EryC1/StrS family aminotransferase [Candidatus Marinimicrobia bacterium]|nr:DegT/DnrJ/EryC1/StrS family aminotransferase [Candidatus Neomarinimicrobiota bacterium]MCF7830361.1 DegT/DnrJ/EryC1/StrS family aminotransferase [Candidatus Neomarinimicrobiota bacterium]MCF7882457.1 DegT/DnrJ/EryC1/StrS family aminotransferase [Candidatus Neomarinimicrobiota bacterium]
MLDLVKQYNNLQPEMDEAIQRVLDSGYFIMGPELKAFEGEVADYMQVGHAVGCASGTDALQVALMALDVGPGDEVITTPFTFVATVEVIALLGAEPVYVDITPDSYTIDPAKLEEAITEKTRAIIPVHLYGQSAHMEEINRIAENHRIAVIEDTAQAIGAKRHGKFVGTTGTVGCISFFPSKNLGAYGDAGMMVTDDEDLAEKLRMITKHGSKQKYKHEALGVNSRLDALQAAILRVKLPHLDEWNSRRAQIAENYMNGISADEVTFPTTLDGNTHIYHQFSIQVPDRDGLRGYLGEKDIPTAIHYPIPLHQQPAFRNVGRNLGVPVAEDVADHIISLPIYPEMPEEDQQLVIETVNGYFS